MTDKKINKKSPSDRSFDDGHDWIVKDKKTGSQLARFHDQSKVLPYAYKKGRDTVDLEKVKREGKDKMSEQRVVNLSEMKLKVVSEDILLPKTNNPEKEAADLTKNTGTYHYADYDDMVNKHIIVNTNVKASNQNEWLEKAYNSPVNEESPVIEPSDYEKNDEYEVTVSDQIAEDDDSDVKDWYEIDSGIYKHIDLPLVYDVNGGHTILFDTTDSGVDDLENAECVGTFEDPDVMKNWIATNLNQDVAEQYRQVSEGGNGSSTTSEITTSSQGVNNDDGDNYGPAPTADQNKVKFDKSGKIVVNESDPHYENFMKAARRAKDNSRQGVQHVNHIGGGRYEVSDWYNGKNTALSYENGREKNGMDPFRGEAEYHGSHDENPDRDVSANLDLDEAYKSDGGSFDSYIDLPDADDVEVTVTYTIHEDDPSVGYQGGVEITGVDEKGTGKDLMDHVSAKDGNRLFDEAQSHAQNEKDDHGDYMYDRMRDDRMDREFDEGKDYRYDPDADDSDFDRQNRFKERKIASKDVKKGLDESESDLERAFMLTVDFTPERLELEYKGMIDIDAAIDAIAAGRSKDQFRNEIQMAGLPASVELKRDNAYTLIVLDTTLRGAIESMVSMDLCQGLLSELEISEDVFFGFLIQAKTGDTMDDTTELDEDEMYEAPEFVVSSEQLNADELSQDPTFMQVMNSAYLEVAEKFGEKVEAFNPSMEQIDEVIAIGIENYPNGARYSFMMTDPMAHDAIIDAFNILWDQGKIGPAHM